MFFGNRPLDRQAVVAMSSLTLLAASPALRAEPFENANPRFGERFTNPGPVVPTFTKPEVIELFATWRSPVGTVEQTAAGPSTEGDHPGDVEAWGCVCGTERARKGG